MRKMSVKYNSLFMQAEKYYPYSANNVRGQSPEGGAKRWRSSTITKLFLS